MQTLTLRITGIAIVIATIPALLTTYASLLASLANFGK